MDSLISCLGLFSVAALTCASTCQWVPGVGGSGAGVGMRELEGNGPTWEADGC